MFSTGATFDLGCAGEWAAWGHAISGIVSEGELFRAFYSSTSRGTR